MLLPPSSGSATIGGYDIVRQPAKVRRRIGYVPQLLSADGSLTARENMLLSARLYGIPWREHPARQSRPAANGALRGGRPSGRHFSGGMIRRLEIAQNLVHRPTVLFLDEPTVGLNPGVHEAVWDHILKLRTLRTITESRFGGGSSD